jgi:hypothetical protein
MNGKIKKTKDQLGNYIYPVTVAEGVYIDSTKTLKQAIADGSLGGAGSTTTVSVSGRGEIIFSLRGAVINVAKNTDDNTVKYSFPTLDTDRYRRMFVWKPGGTLATIDIPNGELLDNDALVYNQTSNTIVKKNGTWGNVAVSQNEYLLLYNNLGNLGGMLSKYVVYGTDRLSIPVKELEAELISDSGSTQGIFIVDDKIYKCAHSNDEHTDFANITVVLLSNPNTGAGTITHNMGHLNAPSYSHAKDSLIVGNGSKVTTLLPKGWIIPSFRSVLATGTIDFSTVGKVELDFTQFTGEYKGQLCWGYESSDIVYLFTNENRILRKISLGKGTNNLGSGVFISGVASDKYNGSYAVLNKWISRTEDTLGGMFFYKGYIYTGVKGTYGIRKCIPLNDGYFDSQYLQITTKTGDMQGLGTKDAYTYAFTDLKGYKFNVSDL